MNRVRALLQPVSKVQPVRRPYPDRNRDGMHYCSAEVVRAPSGILLIFSRDKFKFAFKLSAGCPK